MCRNAEFEGELRPLIFMAFNSTPLTVVVPCENDKPSRLSKEPAFPPKYALELVEKRLQCQSCQILSSAWPRVALGVCPLTVQTLSHGIWGVGRGMHGSEWGGYAVAYVPREVEVEPRNLISIVILPSTYSSSIPPHPPNSIGFEFDLWNVTQIGPRSGIFPSFFW